MTCFREFATIHSDHNFPATLNLLKFLHAMNKNNYLSIIIKPTEVHQQDQLERKLRL